MTKKKTAILVSALALIAVIVVGGTLAYFTDKDARQNVFTLGKVDGTLTEPGETTRDDGTIGKDYTNVKPGDALDKAPYVTLDTKSENAYARVKVEMKDIAGGKALSGALKADILDGLSPVGAGWVKVTGGRDAANGGIYDYYYYQTILTKGDKTTDVFTKVNIPGATWTNEAAESKFGIDVTADLVQSDNFDAQLEKNEAGQIIGWGNVTIEAAK